MKETRPSEKRF